MHIDLWLRQNENALGTIYHREEPRDHKSGALQPIDRARPTRDTAAREPACRAMAMRAAVLASCIAAARG